MGINQYVVADVNTCHGGIWKWFRMVKVILIGLYPLIVGCKEVFKDEQISLTKNEVTQSSIRLDGYYYKIYGNDRKGSVCFFYHDGILHNAGDGFDFNDIASVDKKLQDTNFLSKIKNNKTCWGIFNISENSISFERWYSSEPPLRTIIQMGNIIDDSTFIIIKSMRPNGDEMKNMWEVYKFRKLYPKPDSTNPFVP